MSEIELTRNFDNILKGLIVIITTIGIIVSGLTGAIFIGIIAILAWILADNTLEERKARLKGE